MTSKDSIDDFLAKNVRAPSRCKTCKLGEDLLSDIGKFVDARRMDKTKRTVHELYVYLQDTYGYNLSESTLYNHLNRCLGGVE
jgi:hypothetical protein